MDEDIDHRLLELSFGFLLFDLNVEGIADSTPTMIFMTVEVEFCPIDNMGILLTPWMFHFGFSFKICEFS